MVSGRPGHPEMLGLDVTATGARDAAQATDDKTAWYGKTWDLLSGVIVLQM